MNRKNAEKGTILRLILAAAVIVSMWIFANGSTGQVHAAESLKPAAPALDDFLAPVTQKTEVPEGYTGIYTAEQLLAVTDAPDRNYILMADIDVSSYSWEPLCTEDKPFAGIFDGNGHVISNLNGTNGLFAATSSAQIQNVGIRNGSISASFDNQSWGQLGGITGEAGNGTTISNCYYQGSIESNACVVGGIAGRCGRTDVTIEDCWMKGDILSTNEGSSQTQLFIGGIMGGALSTSFEIKGCIHSGSIEAQGYNAYAGGIAGYGDGDIVHCQNYGTILISRSVYVGGIIPKIDGRIAYCMNAADITSFSKNIYIGGIASISYMNIQHCFNCGNLSANGSNFYYVGGIAGQGSAEYCYSTGTVTGAEGKTGALFGIAGGDSAHCYYLEGGLEACGSMIGSPDITDVRALSDSEMRDQTNFQGYDFDSVWQMGLGDYPYPVLREIMREETPAEGEPSAELSLLLEADKRVVYRSLDGNVSESFELDAKTTLVKILDEEAYQEAPVTVTLKLTGGFSFSPDSLVQEKTVTEDLKFVISGQKEMEFTSRVYILENQTGTVQGTAESEGCETVTQEAFRPELEFLNLQEHTWAMANMKESFQYPEDYEFPVSRYKEVYGEKFGTLIAADQKDVWGGSCGGMAWTSALLTSLELDPADYTSFPETGVAMGYSPVLNGWSTGVTCLGATNYVYSAQKSGYTRTIERYQIFTSELMGMSSPEFSALTDSLSTEYWKLEEDGTYSHRQDGSYIRQVCSAIENSTEPLFTVVAWQGTSHALVIMSNVLEDMGDGWYRTPVYDCNHPYLDEERYSKKFPLTSWSIAYDNPDRYLELNPEKNLFRYSGSGNTAAESDVHGTRINDENGEEEAVTYSIGIPDCVAVYNTAGLAMPEIDPEAYPGYRAKKMEGIVRIRFGNNNNTYMTVRDSETSEVMFQMEYDKILECPDTVEFFPEVGKTGGTITLPADREYEIETNGGYVMEGADFYLSVEGPDFSSIINCFDRFFHISGLQAGEVTVTAARLGAADSDTEALQVAGTLKSGGTLSLSYVDAGTPTAEDMSGLSDSSLAVLEDGGFVDQDPEEPEASFADVPVGEWFYEAIEYVNGQGIMTGMGEDKTNFEPYTCLARAQFAVILHRTAGNMAASFPKSFPDVDPGSWYGPAISWASQEEVGFITGYSNGWFGPADLITREQLALMMMRYADYLGIDSSARADISGYQDEGRVSDFAQEAVEWAVAEGILSGKYNQTQLDPQGTASRAECAVIIQRFMEKYME